MTAKLGFPLWVASELGLFFRYVFKSRGHCGRDRYEIHERETSSETTIATMMMASQSHHKEIIEEQEMKKRLRGELKAWEHAFATDKQAPFGGIIAVNKPLDLDCAQAIAEIFSEVIVAPDFRPDAAALLQKKKSLRLMRLKRNPVHAFPFDVRSVGAESFLLQERDLRKTTLADCKVVSKRQPTAGEIEAMLFGWRVVKHVSGGRRRRELRRANVAGRRPRWVPSRHFGDSIVGA